MVQSCLFALATAQSLQSFGARFVPGLRSVGRVSPQRSHVTL